MESCQVVVVGSGFAGTILARVLHRQGLKVVLIERDRHPRFAIGESSTPLAAICLERLSQRFEMPDLGRLAAYGKWLQHMPEVRRGLKRGFTFYHHHPGQELRDSPENENRLLVAASPDDSVADSHWLREDVDHHLVRLARTEGVDYRDQTEIQGFKSPDQGPWHLSGVSRNVPFELTAEIVIDGSGAGGFLAHALPIPSVLEEVDLDTALVYGHFRGLGSFADLTPGPYPDQRAAVHHILEEGWMYVLPFDHGVVSAGILLRRAAMEELAETGLMDPVAIWRHVIGRYPTLERQFMDAVPTRPLEVMPRVQRLLAQAAGQNWVVLPHTYTFLDPMFSTGIAWSLTAVERLASIFADASARGELDTTAVNEGFNRYAHQLADEAKQMAALLDGAYEAMRDFSLFTVQTFLYFATVSYEEVSQRLFPEGREGVPAAWRGFLGAGDAELESLFVTAKNRLAELLSDTSGPLPSAEREEFASWIADAIAERNIAGLGNPDRRNLYPVDLDLLVERADLVGLTRSEMRASLPRLRGLSEHS